MCRPVILVALAALIWTGCESGQSQQPMDIREFVHQIYIHGVPYEQANAYDSSVVPTLIEMLNDPEEEQYWSNIVVTLGIIGDESAVEPIIEFINRGQEGEISPIHYRAKRSAIMALGYLINKTGNERALNFLTTSLNPQVWNERDLSGDSPFAETTEDRNEDLSKYAVLGLALSGHPQAEEALRSLQAPSDVPAVEDFRTEVAEVVDEALETRQRVSEMGLAEYYRQSQP